MAEEYRMVAGMVETPSYFREKLIKNYVYKGPVLEWYIRIKIRMEKDYRIFHEHLPKEGCITDIGCGYGFMDYMLMFLSHGRKITGIDYDEEKIDVARNCPGKNERIGFICGDVMMVDIPESDAFVISDVLHYMPEEEQEKLILKAIERLKPGGTLMIRDADRELTGEHRRTRLSEFFSTRIGFNRTITGDKKLYFTSGKRIRKILEDNGMEPSVLKESRKTSNIIFVARKKIGGKG
jgi:SAM-dependent methyltransferase